MILRDNLTTFSATFPFLEDFVWEIRLHGNPISYSSLFIQTWWIGSRNVFKQMTWSYLHQNKRYDSGQITKPEGILEGPKLPFWLTSAEVAINLPRYDVLKTFQNSIQAISFWFSVSSNWVWVLNDIISIYTRTKLPGTPRGHRHLW